MLNSAIPSKTQTQPKNSITNALKSATTTKVSTPTKTLQQQMADNSKAYATASLPQQTALHNANLSLASQLGLNYNSGSGSYSNTPKATTPTNTLKTAISNGLTADQQNQINGYSNTFKADQVNGDYKGMEDANDAANQIRNQAGMAAQNASQAINTARTNSTNGMINNGNIAQNINTEYQDSTDAQVAALRSAIAQNQSQYQTNINNADATYQPQINQQEVDKGADLRTALEAAANAGDRGGNMQQSVLDSQTNADNNENAINLQKSQYVNQNQQSINDLNNSESQQELQVTNQNAADRIKALLSAQQDEKSNAIQEAGLTGIYNGQQTMAGKSNATATQAQQLANDAAALQNSYLPKTLKDQATLLAQQVKNGTLDYAKGQAEIDNLKAQTKNVGASTSLGYAELANTEANQAYNKTQDALALSQNNINNAISQIDSLYVSEGIDPATGYKTGKNVVNKTGLKQYVISLRLPQAQTTQLLNRYGVK